MIFLILFFLILVLPPLLIQIIISSNTKEKQKKIENEVSASLANNDKPITEDWISKDIKSMRDSEGKLLSRERQGKI